MNEQQLAAMRQALEALEKVTRELLAARDELAERGGRPRSNVFHQRLWDSSFDAYVNHAIPAAESLRQAIEQAQTAQEPVAYLFTHVQSGDIESSTDPECKDDDREMYEVLDTEARYKDVIEGVRKVWDEHRVKRAEEAFEAAKQRQWVGLTDEEVIQTAIEIDIEFKDEGREQQEDDIQTFARAIEAKLKEKNEF